MNKKSILIILAILLITLLFVSLNNNQKDPSKNTTLASSSNNGKLIFSEDQSLKVDTHFKLGLTRADVYKKLKDLNYKINRDENFENGAIWCESIHLTFGKDNKVTEIFANDNPQYVTAKGLKIGDDVKKIIELYGNLYKKHSEEGSTVYEYQFKNNYFQIGLRTDKNVVTGFGISQNSNY